jgi:tetratricopeptide (TPR) repeat protein
MRSRRLLHVTAMVAAYGVAAGQPQPKGKAQDPKPAGSSPTESSDVPDWRAGPAKFAVAPFENHATGVRAFDWLIAGAPFEIAEKTEAVVGLDPTGGPLYIHELVPAEAPAVADYATQQGATYVITGWVERPNWETRIDATLWRVTNGVAAVVSEAQRTGPDATYHKLLGDVIGEIWTKGGVAIDPKKVDRLARPLATDLYSVKLMGRGLGHLAGVFGAVDLKSAEHDLERAVFIDPKCYEAQRLLGELYLAQAEDTKMPVRVLEAKAAGKFNYATDLAPDDVASLRGAAMAAAHAQKHELALEMFKKLVTRRPWDIEARYQLGNAMWHVGDVAHAEKQLDQVTAKSPDHLPARRVLVLIHASKSDTPKLVGELEAIALRLPDDLEVKADLASAYGALGQWAKATTALEAVAAARPPDLALLMRVGDGHRKSGDLNAALAWYLRAQRLAPQSSYPGFQIAQSLFDAGKLVEASHWYTLQQRYRYDIAAAEEALGAIALIRGQPSDAAWYLRRAVRESPRSLITRRAAIAAELARKDVPSAQDQLDPALAYWPEDGELHYLQGIAFALDGKRDAAHAQLAMAVAKAPNFVPARAALGLLDSGGTPALEYRPQVVRPWGDADAIAEALERYSRATLEMATARVNYQNRMLSLLGTLGLGPQPKKLPKQTAARVCPVGRLAPDWWAAQQQFYWLERAGLELEASYRFIMRHDEAGATAGLLPNARTQVQTAKKSFRTAVADAAELRAEWARGLGPELRAVGCYDKLLAAAVADPKRYQVIEEDQPDLPPAQQAPRAKPRATFYVDNTRCTDPVDVWIDGAQIGQVAPGRRSALVADGGERTLCLLGPGAAQCGDRGTLRQVYLHDGWSVTLYCPK